MNNFIKSMSGIALCVAIPGCSGDGFEGDEIGVAQQTFRAKHAASWQFGVTDTVARNQCNRTSTSQTCLIPAHLSLRDYFIDPGISGRAFDIRAVFSAINTAMGAPSWMEDPAPDAESHPSTVLGIFDCECPGGSTSSNIEAFSCLGMGGAAFVNLTEGVVEDDPVGSYKSHNKGLTADNVCVDMADINARYSNAQERVRLFRQAVGHGVLAWMGLGSRSDSTVSSTWQRATLPPPGSTLSAVSASGVCMYKSFAVNNNTDFSEFHNSACND